MKKDRKCEIHVEKGKFYFSSKRYSEAIKEFQTALDYDCKNTDVLYSLAVTYETSNDYDRAKETYQKVLGIHPEHTLARKHLERMLEK
ncbi:MAG: tetratricopeptide repeat protein [Elusimicrobiota bacterium]